ncbi:MAG TPA: PAS domain S-box protein [Methylomirabilota bacterium]|nr:PAS domain S-box protein [Methylomirabilota bacterium]
MSESPEDEHRRLAALQRYRILDTPPEPAFDDVAELARTLFGAPIAVISLVDAARQWSKSSLGLAGREMLRDHAICAHAILADDVLVVGDARADARFRDLPSVAGAPHVRFYAGAPLRTADGLRLGALCVMDAKPRADLPAAQIAALVRLAGIVMRELEARMAAAATRQAEQQYRRIVENANEGIWLLDPDARTVYANARLAEMLGYGVADMIGRRNLEFMDAAAQEQSKRNWEKRRAGLSSRHEFRFRRRDGTDLWTHVSAVPIQDEGGFAGALAMVTDISERKLVETALRESEARLRRAGRMARFGHWKWIADGPQDDGTGGTSEYSVEGAEILGRSPEELAIPNRDYLRQVVHPDDRAHVRDVSLQLFGEAGPFYSLEYRIIRPDGEIRDIQEMGENVYAADGTPLYAEGTIQDITERKRAEAALRASEAHLRRASRIAKFGHWMWTPDVDGRWTGGASRYSSEGAAILGYDAADLVISNADFYARIVHPDERARLRAIGERVARRREPGYSVEYRIVRPDGTVRDVQEIGENVFDASGRIAAAAGTIQDVTERKRLEEQLRQAQKMEVVARITGGVAHDFNNLLTVILGNAEMLGQRLTGEPLEQRLADMILDAAHRGGDLVSQLLSFARRQPLEPKPVDANGLIDGMLLLLRRSAGGAVALDVAPAADLWPALVDPAQLETALLNLAINARDAMPSGGILRVETANVRLDDAFVAKNRGAHPGDYVMLAVVDNGTGMAPDVAARVFEPFFTTKPIGKGSGLGLSMVYGFVKQSGGYVQIETRVGAGTAVRLYLPRLPEGPALERAAAALTAGTEAIRPAGDGDMAEQVSRARSALGQHPAV